MLCAVSRSPHLLDATWQRIVAGAWTVGLLWSKMWLCPDLGVESGAVSFLVHGHAFLIEASTQTVTSSAFVFVVLLQVFARTWPAVCLFLIRTFLEPLAFAHVGMFVFRFYDQLLVVCACARHVGVTLLSPYSRAEPNPN